MSRSRARARLAMPLLLLLWPQTLLVAVMAILLDTICWPFVWFARRRVRHVDVAPPTRNASVIVLNWNGWHFLEHLLPTLQIAVARAPGDHEVIVVDNGSTDGSAAKVAEFFPWARVVRLPRNLFFIRGNRAGVEAATRDILVFLNNDMTVEPDFLVRLLERFGEPDLFAVAARIQMHGRRVETGCTRSFFKRGAFRLVHVDPYPAPRVPTFWAGGGSSAFDRAKYVSLGGFEDLYEPCYVEDVSLSYQAWKRGWRIEYCAGSVVHHLHRGTSEKVFGEAGVEALDRRNRELFFWRSVTSWPRVLARALFAPWNTLKNARHTGLWLQVRAQVAALPRIPRALWARQLSRPYYRRSDAEVLRLSCGVAPYRRSLPQPPDQLPILISLGADEPAVPLQLADVDLRVVTVGADGIDQPPIEDLFGLVPRRFWGHARDGERRDRLRHVLHEMDHDALLFRDLGTLAAARPHLESPFLVLLGELPEPSSPLESLREHRFLPQLLAGAVAVLCTDRQTMTRLQQLDARLPLQLADGDGALAAAAQRTTRRASR